MPETVGWRGLGSTDICRRIFKGVESMNGCVKVFHRCQFIYGTTTHSTAPLSPSQNIRGGGGHYNTSPKPIMSKLHLWESWKHRKGNWALNGYFLPSSPRLLGCEARDQYEKVIAHPHLLIRTASEQFLLAGAIFGVGLTSRSRWSQLVLVFAVQWWSASVSVGGLLAKPSWGFSHCPHNSQSLYWYLIHYQS